MGLNKYCLITIWYLNSNFKASVRKARSFIDRFVYEIVFLPVHDGFDQLFNTFFTVQESPTLPLGLNQSAIDCAIRPPRPASSRDLSLWIIFKKLDVNQCLNYISFIQIHFSMFIAKATVKASTFPPAAARNILRPEIWNLSFLTENGFSNWRQRQDKIEWNGMRFWDLSGAKTIKCFALNTAGSHSQNSKYHQVLMSDYSFSVVLLNIGLLKELRLD